MGIEFGFDGGDGEVLPPSDAMCRNSGSWIRLGRVLQDGVYGFCAYAIGTEQTGPGGLTGRVSGRFATEEDAKTEVEKRVGIWMEETFSAWDLWLKKRGVEGTNEP